VERASPPRAPDASDEPWGRGRPILEVRRLGRTAYAECRALQERLVERRIAGEITDQLILTEHEPVITVGRKGPREAPADLGIPVVAVERGGEATWHGPGQLVAYPILRLAGGRRDLHRYLRDLEEVAIGMLAEFGVEGTRRPGATGVWIGERKVCSIGVAVRSWVTWHGFALNLHSDLSAFRAFRPCGLDPAVMTRLCDHAEIPPGSRLMEVLAVKHVCRIFELDLPAPARPAAPPPGAGGFPELPILPG
jgi:lipoate-protein ligase B